MINGGSASVWVKHFSWSKEVYLGSLKEKYCRSGNEIMFVCIQRFCFACYFVSLFLQFFQFAEFGKRFYVQSSLYVQYLDNALAIPCNSSFMYGNNHTLVEIFFKYIMINQYMIVDLIPVL